MHMNICIHIYVLLNELAKWLPYCKQTVVAVVGIFAVLGIKLRAFMSLFPTVSFEQLYLQI